jgi:hypothetical protein
VQVFVDGVYVDVAYRVDGAAHTVVLPKFRPGAVLQLLLENMGRINFSHGMDKASKVRLCVYASMRLYPTFAQFHLQSLGPFPAQTSRSPLHHYA